MPVRGLLPIAYELIRHGLRARGARSEYAEVEGFRAHYFDLPGRGTGAPVLLVHGLGAAAGDWWRCMGPLAAWSRRVVAVDLPGFGFSPTPVPDRLGLKGLERFLPAFFDQVLGEPAAVVGNSLGGALATRLTSARPRGVAAAVLVAPAGARMAPGRFHELLRLYESGTSASARELARRVYARRPRLLPYLIAQDLRARLTSPCVRCILQDANDAASLHHDEVRGLKPPLLLIWGGADQIMPAGNLDWYRRHLPAHAEIHEVEEFGHSPHLDRPGALARRIVAFLSRRLGRQAA